MRCEEVRENTNKKRRRERKEERKEKKVKTRESYEEEKGSNVRKNKYRKRG